jgi:hypothetical protein
MYPIYNIRIQQRLAAKYGKMICKFKQLAPTFVLVGIIAPALPTLEVEVVEAITLIAS